MIHYLHDLPEYGGFGQMFFFHRGVIEAIYSRCTYLPLFHRSIQAAFKQLSRFDRFFSVIVSSLVQLFDLLIFVVQGKGVEPWILLIGAPRLLVDILMLLPF